MSSAVFDLTVDDQGNVYVTGYLGTGAFLMKLDASGAVLYSRRLVGAAVAADRGGNAYVAGEEGGRPVIAKVRPDGTALAYMTHPEIAGPPRIARLYSIAVERDGSVAVLVRSYLETALVRLDPAGAVREVRDLGAWFDARRIAVAGDGGVWVAGTTSVFGAPVTPDAILRDPAGCAYYRQGERGTLLASVVYTLVTGPDGVLYAGASEGAFRSRDQGRTWEGIQNGLPAGGVRALAVDPGNPRRLYAGVDSIPALFATSDGGESWEALGEGPHQEHNQQKSRGPIAVDPNNSSVVFAGGDFGTLWKSTDAGRSWTRDLAWPVGVNGIAISPDSTVYVSAFRVSGGPPFGPISISQGGVFRSRDGETFTQLRSYDPPPAGVFADPQVKDRISWSMQTDFFVPMTAATTGSGSTSRGSAAWPSMWEPQARCSRC